MKFLECPANAKEEVWLSEYLPNVADQRIYAQARLRDVLLDAVGMAIQKAGLKRSEIAEKLGTTRGAITRLLGSENPTVKSIADVFWACAASIPCMPHL